MSFTPFTLEGTGGKSVLVNPDHVTHIQPARVDAATPVVIYLDNGEKVQVSETAQQVAVQLGFTGTVPEAAPLAAPAPPAPPPPGIAAWSTGGTAVPA